MKTLAEEVQHAGATVTTDLYNVVIDWPNGTTEKLMCTTPETAITVAREITRTPSVTYRP